MKFMLDSSIKSRGMIVSMLSAAVLTPCALLAEKTTNTYTRTSSAAADIKWDATGFPEVTTTAGSDISIKIDYAEDGEKYQRIQTGNRSSTPKVNLLPIYLDSVIGGKYHNLSLVGADNGSHKYAVINDPTPFEGFWSIDVGPAHASGIYLPDNAGAGVRTIGSAFLKGRFQFGVAPGCEAILDYPFGLGMFEVNRASGNPEWMEPTSVAKPTGKLTINRSPGPYSVAQVRSGTLGIVGGDDDASSPVPDAWARFDASAEGSFTLEGTEVTEWRDADGRPVAAAWEATPLHKPTREIDAVTGKTLVNFGPRGGVSSPGGGSRLKFAEAKDGIAEMFVVMRENSDSKPPAHLFGNAFPRNSSSNYLFMGWSLLPKELAMGEFRFNGQAVVPDFAFNLSHELNVVSAGYRSGGGSVTYIGGTDSGNSASAGGAQIAEILFYTNTLTAAERRRNNDYLMKKWKGVGVCDYGAIMLEKPASLSVESGTVHVRELQLATNGFVKAGSGNLEIESLNTNLNSLVVNGGSVRFVNTLDRGANPQPAAHPLAWFDAADSTTLDLVPSNYTGNASVGPLEPTNYTFISSWRDKSGNGYTLHSPRLGSKASYSIYAGGQTGDEPAWPTLDESTGAHPMVDLGPYLNPCSSPYQGHFGWIDGISGLSTWLSLYKSNGSMYGDYGIRQGFVVFYKVDSRANPINSQGYELRNAGYNNPKSQFVSDNYASVATAGGYWTYDGATVNPSSVSLLADGKAHLGAFLTADAGIPVNVFGSDQSGGNSSGGCKIAEVILYDRVLTEQERLDTERYLLARVNCGTHPADKNISSVGTLSLGDGVDAVFDNDVNMTYGRLERTSSGEIVKKGDGAATVQLFDPTEADVTAVSVEGGSLSLWCDPLADAWAHLDATRADSIEYTTTDGTNYVSRWKDISGNGHDATAATEPVSKPVYRTVTLDADNTIADSGREIPVVDFGEYYNFEQLPAEGRSNTPTNTATAMNFANAMTAMEEFYVVHADTDHWNGSGKNNYTGILGYSAFQSNNYPFLRSAQSPIIGHIGEANGRLRNGYIGVNGSQSDYNYAPTLKQLNVYTFQSDGQVTQKWSLAQRQGYQWGGQVLGEVIMFQNANSEARRNAITTMLCNKWRAQGMPVASSWTLGSVTVAEGATLNVGGSKGFAYTATTLSGLGTITSGPEILGVAHIAAGSADAVGTLSVAADVTTAADAVMDVYFDGDGQPGKVEITGKLTLGGSGSVVLHVPDGVRVEYGEYEIATATSIAVADPSASLTLDASALARGLAKVHVDLETGKVLLRFQPAGMTIIIR